ncbi:MAG: hypothetical protein AAFP86_02245 [Planctomycetota bacterium]
MTQRLLLVAFAVALLAVGGFFLLQSDPAPPVQPIDASRAQAEPETPTRDVAALEGVQASGRSEAVREIAAAPKAPAAPSGRLDPDHPWYGDLAGVTGRLVEEDGTPVPGLGVELIEADVSSLFKAVDSPLGLDSPVLDAAVSGPDGRFQLVGARLSAFHALTIGRGTGRATLRYVEQSLEHGQATDLGDIVLPAFATIVGTVVDEDGEPVAGARVRAAPIPRVALDVGILDVREGVSVFVRQDEDEEIERGLLIDVPDRAFRYLDLLPVPTTMSAADGTFRLEGVPPGSIAGGADMEGHVAAIFGQVDLEAGEEHDVGELELLFGREVTVRVADIGGDPVQGVEVLVGATLSVAPVAILQPAGVTDENGEAILEGIPETGKLVAGARRTSSDDWIPAEAVGLSETIEVTLPTSKPVMVTLKDQEGEPVSGAEFLLRATSEDADMFGMMVMTELVGGQEVKPTKSAEVEAGSYRLDGVTYGSWQVEARAPGYADAYGDLEHRSEGTALNLTMTRGSIFTVTAIEAGTGVPVEGAHITLLGPRGPMFDAYEASFTNASGSAQLGPLGDDWYKEMTEGASSWFRAVNVVAEHPRYGKEVIKLEEDDIASASATGDLSIVLEMPASCTIQGRVSWEGQDPQGLYMLALREDGFTDGNLSPVLSPPRTALSDNTGSFRYTGVAPGKYKLTVMERWLEGDPLAVIVAQEEPTVLEDRSIVVEVGEPNVVDIQLSASGEGPRGRFMGRITSQGSPIAGLEVEVKVKGDVLETVVTDGGGEFETAEYSVMDRCRVKISGEVPMPDGSLEDRTVFEESRRPVSGEPQRIDIDLSYQLVVVRAVDRNTGEPIENVTASLTKSNGRWWNRGSGDIEASGPDGLLEVILPEDGEYTLTLNNGAYATKRIKVSPDSIAGPAPHVTAEMGAAVACAGVVVLPQSREGDRVWIQVRPKGVSDRGNGNWINPDEEDMSFEVTGLGPGEYQAELFGGGSPRRVTFSLPNGGDENLVLDFAEVR